MRKRLMPRSGDRFIDQVFDGLGYGCVSCSAEMTTANSRAGARFCDTCLQMPYRCNQCDAPGRVFGDECTGCSHGLITQKPGLRNTIRCWLRSRGLIR